MSAILGKAAQGVFNFRAQCCQQDRQSGIGCNTNVCIDMCNAYSLRRKKFAWAGLSVMKLSTLTINMNGMENRASVRCTAAINTGTISSFEKVDFRKLQNGSDIRGVAVSGVEGEPINLTDPVAEAIAAAFASWLMDKRKQDGKRLRVSIGHDSRISSKQMQDAFSRGLTSVGLNVIHYGLASTPAMFNSTLTENENFFCPVDGSIMITASHLPYNRNGFKFFTSSGGLGKNDIKDILERAANIYEKFSVEKLEEPDNGVSVKKVDYMEVYTSDLVETVRRSAGNIDKPLEGLHIVVDAGNGAGGFFAGKVLEPLGASTTGSQFLEPDGMFPNHIPNPENKAAMKAIIQAVKENDADLGIIFDTDVDRSAAVDSNGNEFNRNRLIALMSALVLEKYPGTTIVTDSVTSDGLTAFIEKKLGGKHHRFKRGYKNVIDEAARLISFTVFDIETETEMLSTSPSSTSLHLVSNYFGDGVSNSLHEINVSSGVFKLTGYLSRPTDNFSLKVFQYIYINSRLVFKCPIHKLIESLAVDYQLSTSLRRDEPEVQSGKRQKVQGNATYLLNVSCPLSMYDLTFELSKTTIEFKDWTPILSFIEQNVINFWKETLGHLSPDTNKSNSNEGNIPNDVKIGDTPEKSKTTTNCYLDYVWNFNQSPSSSSWLPMTPIDDFLSYDIQRNSEIEHERNSRQINPAYQLEASSSQYFNFLSYDTVCSENRFSFPINNDINFQNHSTFKASKIGIDSPSNDIQDHNFVGSDKDSNLSSTWKDRSIDVDEILKCKSREESYCIHENNNSVPFWSDYPWGIRNEDPKGFTLNVLDKTPSSSNHNGLEIDVHRPITEKLFSLAADVDCDRWNSFTLRRCQKKSSADFFSEDLMKYHSEEDMYFTKKSTIVHTTSSDRDYVNISGRRFLNSENWSDSSYFPNEEITRTIDQTVGDYAFDIDFDTQVTPHANLFDISKYDEFPKYLKEHMINSPNISHGEFLSRIRCESDGENDDDLYLDSNNKMFGRHSSEDEIEWINLNASAKKERPNNFDSSVENYTKKFNYGVSELINSHKHQVTVKIRSRKRCHSAPPFYKHQRKFSITDYHLSDESSKNIDVKFVDVTNGSQEAGITFEEPPKPCSSSQTYVNQDIGCEKVQCPQDLHNIYISRDSDANKHDEFDNIITKWREGDPELTSGRSYRSSDKNDDILDISSGLLNLAGCFLEPESINRSFLEDARVLPQLDRKFIPIVARGNLAVVDQHAADERIRLEELRRKVLSGEANKITHLRSEQKLVLPEMGFQLLQNYTEIIQKWGWICNIHTQSSESYAKNLNILKKSNPCSAVTLVSIPCILGINLTDKDLVEFLEQLAETGGSTTIPPCVNRILNLKACRGAIMFGDALLPSECSLIVEELKSTSLCFQCAHGRPTAAPLVNMVELHKQLDRISKQNHYHHHGLFRQKLSFKRAKDRLNAVKKV